MRDLIGVLAALPSASGGVGLIDEVRGCEDLKSLACARQARATVAFDVSERQSQAAVGVPAGERGKGVAAQVALARRESPHRGGMLVGLARALVTEMPHTLAALEAGQLNEWRAMLLVRETACLSASDRCAVDEDLSPDTGVFEGVGDRHLVTAAKTAAYRRDPRSVTQRAGHAVRDRSVSLRPAPDTMTYLTALLPVTEGVAVHAELTRHADACRAAGDIRSRGQLMADALVERATGTPGGVSRVEVQLIMTDRALFQGDSEPAKVPGYGIVPAGWARTLLTQPPTGPGKQTAGQPAAAGEPTFRSTAGYPTGNTGGSKAGAPKGTAAGALEGSPGGTPAGMPAGAPVGGAVGSAGGPGSGPFPRSGSSGRSGPSGPPEDPRKDFEVWLRRLYTAPGSGELVAVDSKARLFTPGQRRFIQARDDTCRTPYCDAPIRHFDHIVPWHEDGPTSLANGAGLCEACNHTKELPGWKATPNPNSNPDPRREPEPYADPRLNADPHLDTARPLETESRPARQARPVRQARQARHTIELRTPTGHTYRSTAPPLPGSYRSDGVPKGRASGRPRPSSPAQSFAEKRISEPPPLAGRIDLIFARPEVRSRAPGATA